tara:strand:+ start:66 stop:476 length:411 start_codon:yes stop_codon:yes gene_type:complete
MEIKKTLITFLTFFNVALFGTILLPQEIEGRLENANSVFKCSTLPLEIEIFQYGEEAETAIAVIKKGGDVKKITYASWDREGSGVCRYSIWSFDYQGKMSIKGQGCYGEILPPKNSVGEIILHEPEENSRWFFCYD